VHSYQNLTILQNLYRLKALGFNYTDPVEVNSGSDDVLADTLDELYTQIDRCHLCDLSKSRTQSMHGFGSKNASIMFIDHIVSQIQDSQNSYLCGRSGEMLQNMIEKVLMISISDIYFTHTIKCKPLNTLNSFHSEWISCRSYLSAQIDIVRPKVIVTLGEEAYRNLTGDNEEFEKVRGHMIDFKKSKLVPIYHPLALLQNPTLKKVTHLDLKTIKRCL
jgi:DNA polymerase